MKQNILFTTEIYKSVRFTTIKYIFILMENYNNSIFYIFCNI